MRIVVSSGSPRKNGNTTITIEALKEGARPPAAPAVFVERNTQNIPGLTSRRAF